MTGLLTEPDVRLLLEDRFASMAREHRTPGAQIAIHHRGETVTAEFGEPEHGSGLAITADDAFPIGSITKCFTATVAMILVADADIELDEPLGEHLPELVDEATRRLTLRHVLSHTGGLASGPDSDDITTVSPARYVADHVRAHNVVLPAGTGFSYSNMGYVLVGRLIEAITGMTWREATESILLRPLGITAAFIDVPAVPASGNRRRATGHSVNAALGRIRPVLQSLAPVEAPTGALALSATDLVSFGRMHTGRGLPQILEGPYAELMREDLPAAEPFGLADGWGLGLAMYQDGGNTWVGHDGNAHGTSCYLRVDPVDEWIVAFTSNSNTGHALWRDLLAELAGTMRVPVPAARSWVSRSRPVAPPMEYVGTYANGDVEYVVADDENGALTLSVDGDTPARLTLFEDLTFSMRDPESGKSVFGGRFLRDPDTGNADRVQLGGRLAQRCPSHVH
ncbi:serine hydrolase domain-containing protein [Wenjunlia tyrosinilytica]|jgi:CubicO group peptidase (beta-lactamase class C family)|uniref:Serine hydrolase n=1 Tax=Wenjunlia tyrosinilytica TaxID=1544741 RepID=A0A918DR53_9ACTN|nr:serine hydrolase domain-containing protein [Wenjunlia tyrosinilytica]GGO80276.1 serine hydrolase [Wenjunlia tyrosinilytica]